LGFSYWFDKPRFLTEGILAAVLITPSLGVPNWSVIYINTAQQSVPLELAGRTATIQVTEEIRPNLFLNSGQI
jgi:hypothetical protein